MKYYLLSLFSLLLIGCGIDKETAPPLSSESGASGIFDTSFYNNGYKTFDGSAGGSDQDEIHDFAIDSQGRVIAVGSSTNSNNNLDMTVWRLNSSGALDTSFGNSGLFIHDGAAGVANSNDVAYSVTVNNSDEILIAGSSFNASNNYDMVVWKLKSNGVLDTSFATGGIFSHNNAAGGSYHDQGSGITTDSAGKIIVTGYSDQSGTNRDMAVWKLTSLGTLDTGFNTSGFFTSDGIAGGEDDLGYSVITDSARNIYVIGRADSLSSASDMAVWKISAIGSPDLGFNGTGYFTHNSAAGGDGFDAANDGVLASDGSLFIAGYSRNSQGDNDMALWKIKTDGTLDNNFANSGYTTFDLSDVTGGFTQDTGESIMTIDSKGRLVIAGSGNNDMCIWRYQSDGTGDENFSRNGIFCHDSASGGFGTDFGSTLILDPLSRVYIGGYSENDDGNFDATFWRLK